MFSDLLSENLEEPIRGVQSSVVFEGLKDETNSLDWTLVVT